MGQIIDQAWDIYRKHFVEIVSIAAWLLILGALYTIAFALYPSSYDVAYGLNFTGPQIFGMILASLTSFIAAPVMGIWLFSAIVRLIDKSVKGEKVDLKKHAKESWKWFWPLAIVNILFTLLIMSPILFFIPGLALSIIGGVSAMGILAMIGTLLFLIALGFAVYFMILWSVRYFFVGYTVMLEGKRGRAAFTASREVVTKRFWSLLWRIVIPKVLYFLIFALAQYLLVSGLFIVISVMIGGNVELAERIYGILQTIIGVVLAILINPMVLIADYLIYKSAKENKA